MFHRRHYSRFKSFSVRFVVCINFTKSQLVCLWAQVNSIFYMTETEPKRCAMHFACFWETIFQIRSNTWNQTNIYAFATSQKCWIFALVLLWPKRHNGNSKTVEFDTNRRSFVWSVGYESVRSKYLFRSECRLGKYLKRIILIVHTIAQWSSRYYSMAEACRRKKSNWIEWLLLYCNRNIQFNRIKWLFATN